MHIWIIKGLCLISSYSGQHNNTFKIFKLYFIQFPLIVVMKRVDENVYFITAPKTASFWSLSDH